MSFEYKKMSEIAGMSDAEYYKYLSDVTYASLGAEQKEKTMNNDNRAGKFIIFNSWFNVSPSVWFNTEAEARKEAESMAAKNPKDVFYVMEAVSHSKASTVTTEEY